MYLSRNWLQSYIDISDISNDDLQKRITLHIAEVEKIAPFKPYLETVVAGKCTKIDSHPKSDKFRTAEFDVGSHTITLVFAPKFELKIGSCYPIALEGTELPGGTITTQEVQGVPSQGMVCSNEELELSYNQEGLIELPENRVGESILDILELRDDFIEIDNKSITHRPDLWSHYGFARDLSALFNKPLRTSIDFPTLQEDSVVLGEVTELNKHPDADKLNLTKTDIGGTELQIVCGASDLELGQRSPVGQIGTTLPNGLTLKPVKLRGVDSFGMLCSSDELCVPKTNRVIVTFDSTNDEDLGKPVNNLYFPHFTKRTDFKIDIADYENCPKYLGAEFTDLKPKESPAWLKARILVAGMRPINSIVDITNYVLLDIGQPTHAFDVDLLKKRTIGVRTAKKQETLITLDGEERTLDTEDIVITNGTTPVALGGVMGGENTEINDNTTHILIESATFNPVSVRKTSQKLQLRTEAVQRFEKFPDVRLPETGLHRIIDMILELHPECNYQGVSFDQQVPNLTSDSIKFTFKSLLDYAGSNISPKEVTAILERLGFNVTFEKESGTFTVLKPLFRSREDVSIKEDIYEEILRVHGYFNIKPNMPEMQISLPDKNVISALRWKFSDELIGKGFMEFQHYTFMSQHVFEEFGFKNPPELKNPVNDQMNTLRPTIVPQLLISMSNNLVSAGDEQRYFECGTIVDTTRKGVNSHPNPPKDLAYDTTLPYQSTVFTGMYYSKFRETILHVKDIVTNLLVHAGYESPGFIETDEYSYLHPYQTFAVSVNDTPIGYIGTVHPHILSQRKLSQYHTSVFELDLGVLQTVKPNVPSYVATSKFPPIKRDYAFLTPEETTGEEMMSVIKKTDKLVAEAFIFDVYRGKNIENGFKSVAIRVFYSDPEKTLEEKNIEKIEEKLINALHTLGCEQR